MTVFAPVRINRYSIYRSLLMMIVTIILTYSIFAVLFREEKKLPPYLAVRSMSSGLSDVIQSSVVRSLV